ncbi:MAG: hypothetical protein IH604_11165 [Burkholderiales bacterium]|nr:hypothetical protein [Burkholderiales bacterium]
MRLLKTTVTVAALLAFCMALSVSSAVSAQEVDSSIAACLKVWGDHPFGKNPQFKTLGTSAKVFGIGSGAADSQGTATPSLVLVNPIFNVMGETTIDLLNPNGWYCLRTTVSILGKVNIRAHCKAQLAETSDGSAVRSREPENRGIKNLNVTVVGTVAIERPCS